MQKAPAPQGAGAFSLRASFALSDIEGNRT